MAYIQGGYKIRVCATRPLMDSENGISQLMESYDDVMCFSVTIVVFEMTDLLRNDPDVSRKACC